MAILDAITNLTDPIAKSTNSVKNSNQLFVLNVKFEGAPPIKFSFPINPEEISVDQQSRVGVIFTYGSKVFQNLGRGLKTITLSGHTGFRVAPELNNVFSQFSPIVFEKEGKRSYLDLYALIQAIKGENIFDVKAADFKEYGTRNIGKIKYVKLVDAQKFITYDVILRSDKFFRSRTQPNLYRYSLSFVVQDESFSAPDIDTSTIKNEPTFLELAKNISANLQTIKNNVSASIRSINSMISNYSDAVIGVVDDAFSVATAVTEGITAIESNLSSRVDSITRLDSLQDLIKSFTQMINGVYILQEKIKAAANGEAFFELNNNLKILRQTLTGTAQQTRAYYNEERFRRDLTSIGNQGNIQVDRDAWARFETDVYGLKTSSFNIPDVDIKKIEVANSFLYGKDNRDLNYSTTNFNKFFSDTYQLTFVESLSDYNIKTFNAYLFNDFERKNNVLTKQTDVIYTANLPRNYVGKLNFEIQYSSVESFLNSSDFRSIRRLKIREGDTLENLIDSYAKEEKVAYKNYESIVSFLNNIEEPFIITYTPIFGISTQQISDYVGSFSISQSWDEILSKTYINKITRSSFISYYKYNFNENDLGADVRLPLYSIDPNSPLYVADLSMALQKNIAEALNLNIYSVKINYTVGDFVAFNGISYVCIQNNGPASSLWHPTSVAYWSVTTGRNFSMTILKDIYSENLYVLFGVTAVGNNDTTTTILGGLDVSKNVEYFFIVGLERGTGYNVVQDTIFEILNPFNVTEEILDRYAGLERFRDDIETVSWDKCLTVIQNIYKEYLSASASLSFAWTYAERSFFISGTDPTDIGYSGEKGSALFTNFYYLTTPDPITGENIRTKYVYNMTAEIKYKILTNDDYILLPSLSDSFLGFENVLYKDDVYKIDVNQDFLKYEIFSLDTVNSVSNTQQTYTIDFPLIRGIPNVKQAIVNRLDCPEEGLKPHKEYGMPNLLGKKNSLENITLLRYYLYSQLNLEHRVKRVDSMKVEVKQSIPDAVIADSNITLVNNDEIIVRI
jgi:hypothetical protein